MNDELVFDLKELAILIKGTEPTKRSVVAIATKFYDPIGFVAPVTICFKMLFQQLCSSKIEWNEPLTGELLYKWKWLVSEFQGVTTSIPDVILSCCLKKVGFCDASAGVYAAVVYLKIEGSIGTTVNFMASKT